MFMLIIILLFATRLSYLRYEFDEYVIAVTRFDWELFVALRLHQLMENRFRIIRESDLLMMDNAASEAVFLHGDLDLWILEAKALPNLDLSTETMRKCITMGNSCSPPFVKGLKTQSGRHKMITSDPYVSVCLSGATIAQTRIIPNCENPLWDEHFLIPVAHPAQKLEFHVKDNDVLGAELIGVVDISANKILSGGIIDDWFPIVGQSGNCLKPYPELHLSIQFRPVGAEETGSLGVPDTYFPLRKGGSVTLYQDAHVPDGKLPEIPLEDGKVFQHGKCWEEICQAILEAHNLIYIIGWSVYHPVKLIREPSKPLPSQAELSLGELLKYKSQEGVRVVMLIWDDKTSHDKFLLKTDGVMQTHDEQTRKYFKNSTVHCVLAPRYASNTQASGNNRKITAFIGGLDLCDGRYDTPEHRLFDDLDTVFHNDFRNPTFPSNSRGPRLPWHDLHCKVEGPAAYDILINFEQRWRKAKKWRDFRLKKVTKWHEDALLSLERLSWMLTPSSSPDGEKAVYVTDEHDPESWNVQVFRSIDSGSVMGFPKSVEQAKAQNLFCGKNLKVDKSIHAAYVKAIRSAEHFIYIENQYFLGSSYNWHSHKGAGANHLIPMELALKIASKIIANERFSAYIVIPMWPEGVPGSVAIQEILFWQGQTMSMMYKIVADALKKAGLSHHYHPQDYLNFYCLGKREPLSSDIPLPTQTSENRGLNSSKKSRRFMIYVHAKGMIVDDEYVIMGSANINQRSMDGSRDTEIAMGAYQPKYTWKEKNSHPHGQVYGYRMSLWAEHLGSLKEIYEEPKSLECVRYVNYIAKQNWDAYVSEEGKELRGHLMQYPIMVGSDGKVSPLPDHEYFPDVGGKVLGSPNSLPDALTT
ncbi:Phospholipase D delta [Arachis hypogaea]|nr:Phospholipase D delta [Arachis hypogaea]